MKKKYPVIGLTGAAGSGKDTAADILCKTHRFIKLSFADPLYDMVSIATRTPVDLLHERECKEATIKSIGASSRKLLQTLGTEWGREIIDKDIWIRHLEGRLNDIELRTGLNGLIISDVRFQNEVDFIHNLGGEVWLISRLDNPYDIGTRHTSERSPTVVDDLIYNKASLEEFEKAVLLTYVEYLGV